MLRTLRDITPTAQPMTDAELWRTIMIGVMVGSPGVFMLATGMALFATSLGNALLIGIEPAFFCGAFFGGTVSLMRQLHRIELADRADHDRLHQEPATLQSTKLAA